MQDEDFEWDDAKAERNFVTHGVSFEAARLAFGDSFALAREDRRQNYGEQRFILPFRTVCSLSLTRHAMTGSASSRRVLPSHKNDGAIMKGTTKDKPRVDWSRADAMSARERRNAAAADPDNRPMTDAEWAAAPRVPQVKVIRRALSLSQDEFACAFQIPIGTLRDWEQGRKEPDAAARAYLRVIAREPSAVRRALLPK